MRGTEDKVKFEEEMTLDEITAENTRNCVNSSSQNINISHIKPNKNTNSQGRHISKIE